ncbi:MAG: nucleotide exchange factor GrpE [Schleiferiaceae bacterium]|nr:nucleotide exchange factor GrpE [Schleiferiaceae bacterium]
MSEEIKDTVTEETTVNPQAEEVGQKENEQTETTEKKEDKDPIAELEAALAEQKDKNLRLYADFENFRRQNAKKQLEMISTANKDLMSALLPVVDDFERALKAATNEAEIEGLKLIHSKLLNTLQTKGLKKMESTVGKPFDVEMMEAITKIPAPDPKQKGTVFDEIEAGYQLGESIIRYAKVVVAE